MTDDSWTTERVMEGVTRGLGGALGDIAGHAVKIPGLGGAGGAALRFVTSSAGGLGGAVAGGQVGGEIGERIDDAAGIKGGKMRAVGTGETVGRLAGNLVGGWGGGL